MPHAELPSSLAGWAVAIAASLAGFLAGFVVLVMAERMLGA